MRLKKVKLYNFRSFGPKEQEICFNTITAFIGNNSTGKTSALQALLKIFSDNSGDRILKRSDFHVSKDIKLDELTENSLYIEAVFDFPELKEDVSASTIPVFWEHFVVEKKGGMPYLRIRLEASWERGVTPEGSIESNVFYITCPESEEILEDHKKHVNRHTLDKIRMIYVPAVRDPAKQLKNVSGTMLYRVMESINWSDDTTTSISQKIDELNETLDGESGISILKQAIHSRWKDYDSDHRYSNADMKFNNSDIDNLSKRLEVFFSPTVTEREYGIEDMGDGLRSLFYISMVDSILEIEREIRSQIENEKELSFNMEPPVFTIIALEEPENHIAPHLIGKLVKKFNSISTKDCVQAIVASHSPAIIKRIDPESIRYFRLSEKNWSTIVRELTFPDKVSLSNEYKYVKEAVRAYPEVYFSKLVVLGEGDSEEIVLPKFIELKGKEVDSSGISIVPLGGRHVNHFWRLLNDLDIPFVTLLDLDREREGGGWGRIKYALSKLIEFRVQESELLKVSGINMEKYSLDKMHNLPVDNTSDMEIWIDHLEKYDVFFSSPLDLDFMMLESYGSLYKKTLDSTEGPRIAGEGKIDALEKKHLHSEEYKKRIKHDIRQTLKKSGGDGITYNEEQKQLMIWYSYFFLTRGKPATHFQFMSQTEDDELIKKMPSVLTRMIGKIDMKLSQTDIKE